jgi:hypothetical protein
MATAAFNTQVQAFPVKDNGQKVSMLLLEGRIRFVKFRKLSFNNLRNRPKP